MMLRILAVLALAVAVIYLRRDYSSFVSLFVKAVGRYTCSLTYYQLALGPGGTPQTWAGYLRVKCLSIFALRDRYTAFPVPDDLPSREGSLLYFPERKWTRPETRGIAPHRQTNQKSEKVIFEKLATRIESMAPGDKNDLAIGTSCFEKHGTGLFSTSPVNQTCRGEIVHVHPSDGSMHMTLHPADANIILEAGWCERHPLAGVFWNRFLPRGFVMVYAPHNDEEIELVVRIIKAACWFVGEGDAAREASEKGFHGGESLADSSGRPGAFTENYLNLRQIEDPSKALDRI